MLMHVLYLKNLKFKNDVIIPLSFLEDVLNSNYEIVENDVERRGINK